MPRTQGNLIRFTSFGSTVNSLSRNDGQPASNNPPTQNQFSRAPIGIEGFPPLPKRKGSAVQAIQEAEAAGSAAARLAAKSHLQQQQQQQQQRRDQQQKTQQAPSPLTAQQHSQQHSGLPEELFCNLSSLEQNDCRDEQRSCCCCAAYTGLTAPTSYTDKK
uniref:Uncharacterized protein n=1 Tax=Dunaliella tertiolecta TaxID=3047 RepID=A0A7S3VIS3_DUNTE